MESKIRSRKVEFKSGERVTFGSASMLDFRKGDSPMSAWLRVMTGRNESYDRADDQHSGKSDRDPEKVNAVPGTLSRSS
jgi:hypothetical protein